MSPLKKDIKPDFSIFKEGEKGEIEWEKWRDKWEIQKETEKKETWKLEMKCENVSRDIKNEFLEERKKALWNIHAKLQPNQFKILII